MCRILIYKGNFINIKKLLWLPENSLIKQSFKEPFTPFLEKPNIRNHALNVDGSGLAWYNDIYDVPCVYKSTKPPWDDHNLLNLCEFVETFLLFSHIRGIKPFSKYSIVHDYNCHPFQYKNILWMHNGDIENVLQLKKYIYSNVDDKFLNIKGNTDTEYCFSIFLNYLNIFNNNLMKEKSIFFDIGYLKEAMLLTIKKINELTKSCESSLNFSITDGVSIISTRYINSDTEEPPSLYYSRGSEYIYNSKKKDAFVKEANTNNNCILISSEPIHNKKDDWNLIKKNTIISVNDKNDIEFEKIEIDIF